MTRAAKIAMTSTWRIEVKAMTTLIAKAKSVPARNEDRPPQTTAARAIIRKTRRAIPARSSSEAEANSVVALRTSPRLAKKARRCRGSRQPPGVDQIRHGGAATSPPAAQRERPRPDSRSAPAA